MNPSTKAIEPRGGQKPIAAARAVPGDLKARVILHGSDCADLRVNDPLRQRQAAALFAALKSRSLRLYAKNSLF